jgi:hypothetical protein
MRDAAQVVRGGSRRSASEGVARIPLQGPLNGGEKRLGERDTVRDGREAHVASDGEHGRVLAGEKQMPEVLRVDVGAPLCVAPRARGGT